ncbi:50S ribosomal protein L35 [Candidatus Berkelbacteria bacterium CG10_big_fil_rev_8_21_14_0_10_41_12]|uniref:Large ribosomal subunit protein bL35 n=1 Tax=Candidatus Berkelbacteria bacterium CG10_big_fil_rev_8_21_14_0_10_41_12 TaxID=1974513 RepID=A0A2M6WWN0_9BACT|nr:MAG: 50S ribosomal protein L35 [Candidatus Berkelbacteria bacterium CG10_big_fil_rev_8_21_14_0_10_41_12]
MPKIKTRKTVSKRIAKKTASGKLLRRKITSQHLVHRKSRRTRKQSGQKTNFSKSDEKKMGKLAPYI